MTPRILAATALLLSISGPGLSPARAQRAGELFGGELGQDYANQISAKFDQMRIDEMRNDPAFLEQHFTKAELDTFFANTVVEVTIYPDGSYIAYTRPGGELVRIEVGRKKFTPGREIHSSADWRLEAGELATPRWPQKVSLEMTARGSEVSVDCLNKLERTDQTITFYVGPLGGLQCLGLVDEEAPPFDEVLRTADRSTDAHPASPGS